MHAKSLFFYKCPTVGLNIPAGFKPKILFLNILTLTTHNLNLTHYSNIREYKQLLTSYNSILEVELNLESELPSVGNSEKCFHST
jgi:hypothetical protein